MKLIYSLEYAIYITIFCFSAFFIKASPSSRRIGTQRVLSRFRSTPLRMSSALSSNHHGFSLQQTMLRIKDPAVSVPFYEKHFGMKLLHKYDFPQWNFGLFFLGIPPPGDDEWPTPGTKESEAKLWTMQYSCLELTWNYGSEKDESFEVNNGNVEPFRGFGHIAMMTPDVYAACAKLEADGVEFQKRPDEGRMKGLAFVKDPQGYWIEIITRSAESVVPASIPFTLAQTMFRVKDPKKSIKFYRDLLGMTLVRESHFSDFSLYFLAHLPPGTTAPAPDSPEAPEFIRKMYPQVLELTHNHGTETDESFSYHNGNDQDKGQLRGFGHCGFLCENLDSACEFLQQEGVSFKKLPSEGTMRGLAFAFDPDHYWVEIIQKGGITM